MNPTTCRTLSPHPSIECVRAAGHNGKHRSYRGRTWTDEPADYADGGVTAAAIEAEVVSPERARSLVEENAHLRDLIDRAETYAAETIAGAQAETTAAVTAKEQAEQDRDRLAATLATTARQRDEADKRAATASPRALGVDDITEAMCIRAADSFDEFRSWEGALIAALTEPPARPEGAEELARMIASADVGEWDCGDLADALLATGRVRVTGAES